MQKLLKWKVEFIAFSSCLRRVFPFSMLFVAVDDDRKRSMCSIVRYIVKRCERKKNKGAHVCRHCHCDKPSKNFNENKTFSARHSKIAADFFSLSLSSIHFHSFILSAFALVCVLRKTTHRRMNETKEQQQKKWLMIYVTLAFWQSQLFALREKTSFSFRCLHFVVGVFRSVCSLARAPALLLFTQPSIAFVFWLALRV